MHEGYVNIQDINGSILVLEIFDNVMVTITFYDFIVCKPKNTLFSFLSLCIAFSGW